MEEPSGSSAMVAGWSSSLVSFGRNLTTELDFGGGPVRGGGPSLAEAAGEADVEAGESARGGASSEMEPIEPRAFASFTWKRDAESPRIMQLAFFRSRRPPRPLGRGGKLALALALALPLALPLASVDVDAGEAMLAPPPPIRLPLLELRFMMA